MRTSMRLASLGLICLLASLFMPSIQLEVMGKPAIFNGYQAAFWGVAMGGMALLGELNNPFRENLSFILSGFAVLLNAAFLIAPLILKFWIRRSTLLFNGLLSAAGLLSGLFAPVLIAHLQPIFLIGYFVWLIGYVFLLASIVQAWKSYKPFKWAAN